MTTSRWTTGVLSVLALASFASVLAQPAVREARPSRQYDTGTFFQTVSMSRASFSADGSWLLVTSDESGVPNAWRVSLADGERTPLTRSDDTPMYTVGVFPSDDRILMTADGQGNELNHLLVRETDGSLVDVTPGEGLKASFLRWSADETSFFAVTNERDEKFFDLYRYALEDGYPRTLVYQNEGYRVAAVTGDGRTVALLDSHDNKDNDILVWDATHPEAEPALLTPHEGDVDHGVQGFDPEGERLYYTSDVDHEFHRLWSVPVTGGEPRLELDSAWDVAYHEFSRDGRVAMWGVNADGRTEVTAVDRASGERLALPETYGGSIQGAQFERGSSRVAFFVNGDTSPSHLHMADLESGEVTLLANTLAPGVDEADLVASTVVRYPSFDGLAIPALLYRPHQASAYRPVPAIVFVHGGPGGQTRVGYKASFQHLLNHGYAILAVNNRGSSGYGKTFFHLDDRRHGDVDLADCVAARAWLSELDWVDGSKVGIMGGSYGGYMVAAALAFEPEAFDVGINIFGVTNWLRTLESIPPWWSEFRDSLYAEMGDPATDRERLIGNSPLFHADKIVRPLLVVQGANDPRVLQVESDELVAAVRANDVPVEYVLFPDEGHGFRQRKNRITASDAYLAFLDEHLKQARAD